MMDPVFPTDFEAEEFDDDDPIEFHCEDCTPPLLPPLTAPWIRLIIEREKAQLSGINFIFCSDDYLHDLNVQYLDHDTLTDIITFPYAELPFVEGDIFISVDRVRENATTFDVSFEEELNRVMIHGVLHLCGYSDKTPDEKKRMTAKENEALQLLRELPAT